MFGETKRFGAHADDGKHFLVGNDLRFDVRQLFRIGETFSLI